MNRSVNGKKNRERKFWTMLGEINDCPHFSFD